MSKFWCIYRITNLKNGKTYIGQHKVDSLLTDDGYLGSGKLIIRAIEKYGPSKFKKEYITFAMTQQEADVLEKFYIAKEKPVYNISKGGQGVTGIEPWNKGKANIWTKEQLERNRQKHLNRYNNEKNPFYGKHHTEETKEKLRKKVICLETKCIFNSLIEAARFANIKSTGKISECCRGTRKTAGGYHWKYFS